MSNAVTSRLAQVALRAVLAEVEREPELAGEVLARMLGTCGPAPDDIAANLGRQVLAAGGNEDDDQAEEPAPRPRKRPGPKPGRPKTPATGEAAGLIDRLAEAHGSLNAAARALKTSPPLVRGWRKGKAIKPVSLERLRAAVAELDPKPDQAQGDAGDELPEAVALVAQLEARHGGLGVVAERFGLALPRLQAWAGGAPATPNTLDRLRAALAQPTAEEVQGAARGPGAEVAPSGPAFRRAGA